MVIQIEWYTQMKKKLDSKFVKYTQALDDYTAY